MQCLQMDTGDKNVREAKTPFLQTDSGYTWEENGGVSLE